MKTKKNYKLINCDCQGMKAPEFELSFLTIKNQAYLKGYEKGMKDMEEFLENLHKEKESEVL